MIELFWTETEVQNQEIETKTKIEVFLVCLTKMLVGFFHENSF